MQKAVFRNACWNIGIAAFGANPLNVDVRVIFANLNKVEISIVLRFWACGCVLDFNGVLPCNKANRNAV